MTDQSKTIQAIEQNPGQLFLYAIYGGNKDNDNLLLQFAKGDTSNGSDELTRLAMGIEGPSLRTGIRTFAAPVVKALLTKAGVEVTDEDLAACRTSEDRLYYHTDSEIAISTTDLFGEEVAARFDIEVTESLTPNPLVSKPERDIVMRGNTGIPKAVVDPYTGETHEHFYRHTRIVLKATADEPTRSQSIDQFFSMTAAGNTPRDLPADVVAQVLQRKAMDVLAHAGERELEA